MIQIKDTLGKDKVLLNHKLTTVKQEKDGWTAMFDTHGGEIKVSKVGWLYFNLIKFHVCFRLHQKLCY